MTIDTKTGISIDVQALQNYFKHLVNRFFKILPIRENEEGSLVTYMQCLQAELLGCKELVLAINNDPSYLRLLSILQYLIDNPTCSQPEVKRYVFQSISLCNRLKAQYLTPPQSLSQNDGEEV